MFFIKQISIFYNNFAYMLYRNKTIKRLIMANLYDLERYSIPEHVVLKGSTITFKHPDSLFKSAEYKRLKYVAQEMEKAGVFN